MEERESTSESCEGGKDCDTVHVYTDFVVGCMHTYI